MINLFRKPRAPEVSPEPVPVANPNRAGELTEKGYPELARFLASPLGATALRAAWRQIDEHRTSEAKEEQPHPRLAAIDHQAQRYYEVYPTGHDLTGAEVYVAELGAQEGVDVRHTTGTRYTPYTNNIGVTTFEDPFEPEGGTRETWDYPPYNGAEVATYSEGSYRDGGVIHPLVRVDAIQAIANIDPDQPRSNVPQNPDRVLKNLWVPPTR